MKLSLGIAVSSAILLSGCATTREPASVSGLGARDNPIKADMPPGQREYLSRLRCGDGKAPAFERQGSMGMANDGHVVDGYAVTCAGTAAVVVHMDMYHQGYKETRAVKGFTLASGD